SLQILLLLLGVGLLVALRGKKILQEYLAFRAWRKQEFAKALSISGFSAAQAIQSKPMQPSIPLDFVDPTLLPGAGRALANPPKRLQQTIDYLRLQQCEPFSFPLGWTLASDGVADCVSSSFVGDVNHVLLTGFTDSGKDSWAATALFSLALTMPPERLQLAIIDGKGGLSWIGWGDRAHVWMLAKQAHDIRPAMDKLKLERSRRIVKLEAAGCEKWDDYDKGDMPLLVVFVSELMLLQDATSKSELADWLNTELTSARAAGIRYIVSSQTVTRMDTRWRSQVGLYIAGYQPRDDADEPNTTFPTKDLLKFGRDANGSQIGIPPSALPVPPKGAGVFTCVQGRTVITVRASYIDRAQRQLLLAKLPERKNALQVEPVKPAATPENESLLAALFAASDSPTAEMSDRTVVERPIGLSNGLNIDSIGLVESSSTDADSRSNDYDQSPIGQAVLPAESVPVEEQRKILAFAPTVKSKRQLSLKLYGVDGGEKYRWVRQTCEAAGLLAS
ncbi:MAG TPA: FtsK/SpoIIIE domain-containing protein, partial [Cellvibrio sp.]